MAISLSDEVMEQYHALVKGCGYHRFPERTILALTGPDRVKFLQNFCTADVKKLAAGEGTETFITNVQGKTIGYVTALILEKSILLEGAAGQAAALVPHLEKYTLLDDAELPDRSGEWPCGVIAGSEIAQEIGDVELLIAHEGNEVRSVVYRSRLLGSESWSFIGQAEELGIKGFPHTATPCGPDAVEMRRLEAGMPQFGTEVTEANLPQEVGRDKQAISFTKGCYLGQETVARIDSLGHVNRYLRLVKFSGDVLPDLGWQHAIDGKPVLTVTSTAYSPMLRAPIALAYLRRGHESIGTTFDTELGAVEVIPAPAASIA